MMVVAIIGLLAAVAMPKFANMITRVKEAQLRGRLGTLRSTLNIYYADMEGFYPQSLGFLQGRYIDPRNDIFAVGSFQTHPHDLADVGASFQGHPALPWPGGLIDLGGFGYWLTPANPPATTARVFINCTHTDTRGTTWSRW